MEMLTRIEEIILLAVLELGAQAYGVTIRERVKEITGKSISVGAIYIPLERLKEQRLLKDWQGDPTPERGGRRKRFYRVTSDGMRALRESKRIHDSLWKKVTDRGLMAA
jgi:DNA-binding PadR family transcriptional regulator